MIEREDDAWVYRAFWAHSLAEEATAAAQLVEHLAKRRIDFPAMHVYHYNHTERSQLQALTTRHGVAEDALTELVDTGAFVDIFAVVRGALRLGAESYSLKAVERLTDFERDHEIDKGAGAVVAYEAFMVDGDDTHLRQIARYNEDDVIATLAVRDWLLANRPDDATWRPVRLEAEEGSEELNDLVVTLHGYPAGSTEHDLGDLLGYWRREALAERAPKRAKLSSSDGSILEDPDAIGGLVPVGSYDRFRKDGKPAAKGGYEFRFPEQEIGEVSDGSEGRATSFLFERPDGTVAFTDVDMFDRSQRTVGLQWPRESDEVEALGLPHAVVVNDYVNPKPKPEALAALCQAVLPPGTDDPANPAALALLRREVPRFLAGGGPPNGRFTDDVDEMCSWVTQLDGTCVAVQGPPRTGKTYRGAHLARTLILAGKRDGITALSHSAIANFVAEVVAVFTEAGDLDRLRAVRKTAEPQPAGMAWLKHTSANDMCAKEAFNLVAGTTWLFAGDGMAKAPVDVLFVDEAGQFALADTLAACRSARNLVFLGDPAQLPQVDQAVHPGVSGRSALGHVLGHEPTMPADRGVFITETRRMHPDICDFISQTFYDGRLTSHASCAGQGTDLGTGLRWLPVAHEGRSTSSPEEAEAVRDEIRRLIGIRWTDQHGTTRPIEPADLMVVAPFNDQVALLRACLEADPVTAGTPVGTVDKFQGQQAAAVFFTMTTSSEADITRGLDFLFSQNRLNVAVSRARCLAYLVANERVLDTRAKTVEDMIRLAAVCSFIEAATPHRT